MILPKQQSQSEADYARYLERIATAMTLLVRTEGWAMLKEQLEHEQKRSFMGMTTATTVDVRAMASVEYTTLTRMLEAPEALIKQASATLAAAPKKP